MSFCAKGLDRWREAENTRAPREQARRPVLKKDRGANVSLDLGSAECWNKLSRI